MENKNNQIELADRSKIRDDDISKLAFTTGMLRNQVTSNAQETQKGNLILPEMEEKGNLIQVKLNQANQKLNQLLSQTSDWTIYYVLLIEFILFILFIFM